MEKQKLITTINKPETKQLNQLEPEPIQQNRIAKQHKSFLKKDSPLPPQPFNDERAIKSYKRPRRGVFGIGIGCRGLSCGCFILIILLVTGVIYLFSAKPSGLWNATVDFLNTDNSILSSSSNTLDSQTVKNDINNQIKTIGDTDFIITQEQLTALAKDKFSNFRNLSVLVTKSYIRLYWDLDQTISSNTLKGIIELKLDSNNKLYLNKVGTGRIGLPNFLNNFMTNTFYSILNINNANKDDKYGFLLNLIPASNLKIKQLELDDKKIHIKANIKVDLFNN